ncbi:hypothetical protein JCM8547_007746 [Rhodosporidiobolus lusitaniae]
MPKQSRPLERHSLSRPRSSLTLQLLSPSLSLLRLIQRTSAVSFSLFTFAHLLPPLSALLPSRPQFLSSAENRANGILLLVREVYQGEWSEPVLVWGSLAVHVGTGVAVRWLTVLERLERRKVRKMEVKGRAREMVQREAEELLSTRVEELAQDLALDDVNEEEAELVATTTTDEEFVVPSSSSASPPLFTPPNLHHKTGYALLPFVLHHAYLHRLLPSSPFPPISALSPSFFNYSFTALSLNHSNPFLRFASIVGYAGVTLLGTYHALVGWRILLDPTAPRSLASRRKRAGEKVSWVRRLTGKREWQAAWVALVAAIAGGTARIAGFAGGERSVKVPEFVARRMQYVLRRGMGMKQTK